MLRKELITICFENYMKHTNEIFGRLQSFLVLKQVVQVWRRESKIKRWPGHVTLIGKARTAHQNLTVKPKALHFGVIERVRSKFWTLISCVTLWTKSISLVNSVIVENRRDFLASYVCLSPSLE